MSAVLPAGIFKAYDVRGLYGDEMDGETAYLVGRGFARVLAELRGKPAARASRRARPRHAPPGAGDGRPRSARASSTRAAP